MSGTLGIQRGLSRSVGHKLGQYLLGESRAISVVMMLMKLLLQRGDDNQEDCGWPSESPLVQYL